MVLFDLTEFAVKSTWYLLKGVYNLGYWSIYGTPETEEERKIKEIEMEEREQSRKLDDVQHELLNVQNQLNDLKELLQQNQSHFLTSDSV